MNILLWIDIFDVKLYTRCSSTLYGGGIRARPGAEFCKRFQSWKQLIGLKSDLFASLGQLIQSQPDPIHSHPFSFSKRKVHHILGPTGARADRTPTLFTVKNKGDCPHPSSLSLYKNSNLHFLRHLHSPLPSISAVEMQNPNPKISRSIAPDHSILQP